MSEVGGGGFDGGDVGNWEMGGRVRVRFLGSRYDRVLGYGGLAGICKVFFQGRRLVWRGWYCCHGTFASARTSRLLGPSAILVCDASGGAILVI